MKRAQILNLFVTASVDDDEEEEEEAPSPFDDRHSTALSSTFGMATKPSNAAPKHPPKRAGSSCGEPAKGSPPHAWKSAPSWQRVKMVELSNEEEEEELGTTSDARSRGPCWQPLYPPSGAKYVALRP